MKQMPNARVAFVVTLMGVVPAPAWSEQDPLDVFRELVLKQFTARLTEKLSSPEDDKLKLRYIEPDANGQNSGFGVTYDWSARSNGSDKMPSLKPGTDFAFSRLSYDLSAKGAYAFGDAQSNQNLSEIIASAQLMRANYGRLRFQDEAIGPAFQKCLGAIPAPTTDAAQRRENDRKFTQCIEENGIDTMLKQDTMAYGYWFDFHGGVEGNQNLAERHTVFGLAGAFVSQPSEAGEQMNILDWPFRQLRRAFSPDGNYVAPFPSVRLMIERLDAKDDAVRASLTDELTFTRASGEVTFNTIVASTNDGPVRFNISYRYFYELSAPRAIHDANLDTHEFTTAAFYFPARLLPLLASDNYEFFVRYTNGKLPFDLKSNQAYEVGISTNFKWLGELLQR
jgi:hypothetical protein